MIIRKCTIDDLNNGYINAISNLYSDITHDNAYKYIVDNRVYVALSNNIVMGTATLVCDTKPTGRFAGRIEDVSVAAKYIGLGVGSALVQYLIDIAKKLGCYKVILNCAEHNIGFYEKCGFKKHDFGMRYSL